MIFCGLYYYFSNKIWNAFRFACAYITEDSFRPSHDLLHLNSTSAASTTTTTTGMGSISKRDLFILSRLHTTLQEVNSAIGSYLFGAATTALHSFFLYDVCDTYLELLKPVFAAAAEEGADPIARDRKSIAQLTLYTVLEQFLRLTHPLMPFVTEELWQRLPNRALLWPEVSSIMLAPYPEPVPQWFSPQVEADFELLKEVNWWWL